MKIRVVLSRTTLDLIWALGNREAIWRSTEQPLGPDEAAVELDEDVVIAAIDLFDEETFDKAIQNLAHSRLSDKEDAS
jgi:hypothetical protein